MTKKVYRTKYCIKICICTFYFKLLTTLFVVNSYNITVYGKFMYGWNIRQYFQKLCFNNHVPISTRVILYFFLMANILANTNYTYQQTNSLF
jgi:hypothetical protein